LQTVLPTRLTCTELPVLERACLDPGWVADWGSARRRIDAVIRVGAWRRVRDRKCLYPIFVGLVDAAYRARISPVLAHQERTGACVVLYWLSQAAMVLNRRRRHA
jgi:hypothetical protein